MSEGGQTPRQAAEQALGEVREQLRARVGSVRKMLATVPVPQGGPPTGLLGPGKRLELCIWLQEQRRGVQDACPTLEDIPDEPAALLDYTSGLARTLSAPPSEGLAACPLEFLSLVANEEAPLILAADADTAAHPYLCLHRFGVRADTPTAAVKEQADFEVPKEPDPTKRELLQQALTALSSDRRRLAEDVRLVPCADPEALTQSLRQVAADFLAGRRDAEPDLTPLQPMDQATLLAAAGRAEQAAALAWDALERQPTNGTLVHHAFLLAAHHAATLLARHALRRGDTMMHGVPGEAGVQDLACFPDAVRRVFALHGMLTVVTDEAGTKYLERLVFRRCTAYGRALPPDLGEHLEAVGSKLRKMIERLLTAFTRADKACAREARTLRSEWQAETEGAHLATERKIRVHRHKFAGGYLAARFLSQLDEVGSFIHGAFGRLSNADENQRLSFISLVGMAPEACQRLILLFSDFRLAEVEPDEQAIAFLTPLTPDTQELPYADTPPAVTDVVEASDFAARFPVHACLGPAEREGVLAAHAALLMAKARLAETRRLLAGEQVSVADVVSHLDAAVDLSQYVTYLGYELVDPVKSVHSALAGMLLDWLYSLQKRLDALDGQLRPSTGSGRGEPVEPRGDAMHNGVPRDDKGTARGVERIETELGMADRFALSPVYGLGKGNYSRTLTQVHANFAVFLANRFDRHKDALTHVRKAHRSDPEGQQILINFVRACGLHAFDLKKGGSDEEASQVLREGINEGRRFLDTHPDASGDDIETLKKELGQLESLLTKRPRAPLPALGWRTIDSPDEE